MSLHDPIGTDKEGNEITLIDILGTEADDVVDKVQLKIEKSKIYRNLEILDDREKEVVVSRFGLGRDNPNMWTMDKLGTRISPLSVIKNGNRNMHAVNTGLYYEGTDGSLIIETMDAPIVCPGERRLLQFNNTFAPLEGGFHFNLHNNVWGTNFRMWFEEDMKYRFRLLFKSNR